MRMPFNPRRPRVPTRHVGSIYHCARCAGQDREIIWSPIFEAYLCAHCRSFTADMLLAGNPLDKLKAVFRG